MDACGSPEVVCWTSDYWVAGSNPLRGACFIIYLTSLSPVDAWHSLAYARGHFRYSLLTKLIFCGIKLNL